MWVFDEDVGLNCRDVTFVPGLYKIFDEILVNAADNKQRDKNMSCIKVTIDPENNTISVWNNGKGIPVVEHKVEKVYVPALIFGQLLTSSNYDDDEKKVTGREESTVYANIFEQSDRFQRVHQGEVSFLYFTVIMVKNHMWIFVNALIENPTFDSQTKENMTLQAKSFGSTCKLSEKFIKGAVGCGIVESILNWVKFKAQTQLNKKCSAVKHTKIKGVPKLDDANDAGSKNSIDCTLILTEGDSAKTLAVSGLGVVGRDKYGVFPLRGKILNVREASHKQIMENAEINNIIKIVGLQYKKNYEDQESLKTLRYGKIMIMTDQVSRTVRRMLSLELCLASCTRSFHFSETSQEYLYGKDTNYLTYNDFINKELVLFSNSDNERSIPSLVDGLKPGQRKVLFTCFKRNDKREVKVAQLAGSVAEMSSYHHGEASLMMTIINLAQNFVGSNNLNLLQPIGQFGTRLHGGKDSASPRYIFTMLRSALKFSYFLIQRGYESDPVKAWKELQNKEEEEEEEDESNKESAAATGPDFNYLLNMPLWYLTKEKKDELCKQRDNKEKELENLKCKSPCDLWKEDLAAFVEELDAVEAKQMQDEMAGLAGKPLKVKGGKTKVKKAQLPEVMPSAHGIRVVPRVTAEMKADAEKRAKKKVKSEKNELDENQEGNSSGDKESSSLKQRIAQKRNVVQGTKRQATLPFKPVKKTKKRNPWFDSGSDSESDDFEVAPQRERVVRQAAAKIKPMICSDSDENFTSSDEESEFQRHSEGSSESDTNSKEKPAPKPRAAPKLAFFFLCSVQVQAVADENVSQAPAGPSVSIPHSKAVPKKPAAAKKASAAKDNQPSIMDILAKKKAVPKSSKTAVKEEPLDSDARPADTKKPGPTKGRKVIKRQPSSSDLDSDFSLKPSKSVAAKKSKQEDSDSFTAELTARADSPTEAAPRARPGRLKKPVQYLESSDDDMF
uniref:DNA topoisomerase 2 n=1 Tax=Cairina moschata TaxID=8855 RepID=A0A8C3BS53_CAIMO